MKRPGKIPPQYTIRKVKLSSSEFKHLVSVINDSGYWKLPYAIPCNEEFFDGYGFSLEANTKNKYNFVEASVCSEDKGRFKAICKEIVQCAGLEKEVYMWFPHPKQRAGKPVTYQQGVNLEDVKPDNVAPSKSMHSESTNNHLLTPFQTFKLSSSSHKSPNCTSSHHP